MRVLQKDLEGLRKVLVPVSSKPIQQKKSSKSPKKKTNEEVIISKTTDKPVESDSIEPTKEIIPSKTGVFKHIKKNAHK